MHHHGFVNNGYANSVAKLFRSKKIFLNFSKMVAAAILDLFELEIAYPDHSPQPVSDPIYFIFGSRVGFSGTADLMALFSVRTNLG